jgi:4-hydroxy-tetrahydrodipicolinate synthase
VQTETLIALAEHPRIVAVKDAKGDIPASTRVLAETGLVYYSGSDDLNLAMLAVGATGMVSVVGHVAADKYAAMVRAADAGDYATARQIDRDLLPAVRGIMTYTQGAIMAKAALQLRGVLDNRVMRAPLPAATDDEYARLRADLTECGLVD